MAEPDSHPTTPPRTQPLATSATAETPATIGGGGPPGFEFEFQLENVDPTTGMMVEGHRMAWDEMTQESTALYLHYRTGSRPGLVLRQSQCGPSA